MLFVVGNCFLAIVARWAIVGVVRVFVFFHAIFCFCVVLYSMFRDDILVSIRVFNTLPKNWWVNCSFCFPFLMQYSFVYYFVAMPGRLSETGLFDFYWIVDCFEKRKSQIAALNYYFVLRWWWPVLIWGTKQVYIVSVIFVEIRGTIRLISTTEFFWLVDSTNLLKFLLGIDLSISKERVKKFSLPKICW